MELLRKIHSKTDNVIKYVFKYNDKAVCEFSYIDSGTGKDIICVPCQTMCSIGCKFCHTTKYIGEIPVHSLTSWKIAGAVAKIIGDIGDKKDTILISYMGCGEPFNVIWEDTIIGSMTQIRQYIDMNKLYKNVRFALSTCLPENGIDKFFDFTQRVKQWKLPVKLHFSLHFTNDVLRKEWMPASLDIKSSLALCKFYKEFTGNDVEIHYTLMDGINDSDGNLIDLQLLLYGTGFSIKFITYNEKDDLDAKRSERAEHFKKWVLVPAETFTANGEDVGTSCGMYLREVTSEIYTPPGRDIGSSCGMFLMENNNG